MHASLCGRGTGLRCRPAPSTRIRWSTSRPPNRSSISVSRRCAGRRLSSIPIPGKSALASPIRQARSASAALACFGPEAARSITGRASPRRAEFGPAEASLKFRRLLPLGGLGPRWQRNRPPCRVEPAYGLPRCVRWTSGNPSDAAGPEQFVADSAVEEDGFELAVPREGKGYGEPLKASIAVSGLNL